MNDREHAQALITEHFESTLALSAGERKRFTAYLRLVGSGKQLDINTHKWAIRMVFLFLPVVYAEPLHYRMTGNIWKPYTDSGNLAAEQRIIDVLEGSYEPIEPTDSPSISTPRTEPRILPTKYLAGAFKAKSKPREKKPERVNSIPPWERAEETKRLVELQVEKNRKYARLQRLEERAADIRFERYTFKHADIKSKGYPQQYVGGYRCRELEDVVEHDCNWMVRSILYRAFLSYAPAMPHQRWRHNLVKKMWGHGESITDAEVYSAQRLY